MNAVYRALSDPTRRAILRLLRERDRSAGELADEFPQSKPAMSKHFTVLKDADLIQGRRQGTTIMYTLNVSVLEEAVCALMDTFSIQPKAVPRKGSRNARAAPRTAE
jgi:DNA-binding transcriptional ArsR family regulator